MKRLFILLSFVIMMGCAKEESKPSCDAVNNQIESIDKQVEMYSCQQADGLITMDEYLNQMDRLITAKGECLEQLKDCE